MWCILFFFDLLNDTSVRPLLIHFIPCIADTIPKILTAAPPPTPFTIS